LEDTELAETASTFPARSFSRLSSGVKITKLDFYVADEECLSLQGILKEEVSLYC
jgi:hypothetical protein